MLNCSQWYCRECGLHAPDHSNDCATGRHERDEQLRGDAQRLTAPQRHAIELCYRSGNQIIQGGQDDSGISTRVIESLRMKGLLEWVAPSSFYETAWKLSARGLALRAIIRSPASSQTTIQEKGE